VNVLIANDDGIFSPGIFALASAMCDVADKVLVVAPDVEQSAVGHAITIRRPLRYTSTILTGLEVEAYRVDGTPADCVIMGIRNGGMPDVVISGINLGVNIGYDVTHSGTVAAAIEGMTFGVPAIAFSLEVGSNELDFQHIAAYAKVLVPHVVREGLPERIILNVNFPSTKPRGINVVRQSTHGYDDEVVRREDPEGVPYYWITGSPRVERQVDSDFDSLRDGYAAVTPLYFDLTHETYLRRIKDSLPPLTS
jgi:5'-nucleotidase